jgi:hypothetical protein
MGSSTATSTAVLAFWHGPDQPPGTRRPQTSGGGRRAQDRCRPGGRPTDAQPLPRTPIRRQPACMRRATETRGAAKCHAVRLTPSWRKVGQCRSRGAVLVEHPRDPRGSKPTMQAGPNNDARQLRSHVWSCCSTWGLMTAWPAGALRALLEHHHTQGFSGRKPQQPVISPAKKIRPGRCGAATLRLVAAKRANRVESEHVPDGWRPG